MQWLVKCRNSQCTYWCSVLCFTWFHVWSKRCPIMHIIFLEYIVACCRHEEENNDQRYIHNYNEWCCVLYFMYGEETDGQSYSWIPWLTHALSCISGLKKKIVKNRTRRVTTPGNHTMTILRQWLSREYDLADWIRQRFDAQVKRFKFSCPELKWDIKKILRVPWI